jgi:hypothetical protein
LEAELDKDLKNATKKWQALQAQFERQTAENESNMSKAKRIADDALKTNGELQQQVNVQKQALDTITKEKQKLETDNDNLERKER